MTEPLTVNLGLVIPNTGDLSGAWGTSALNANFQATDGLFGGVQSFSLSAATTITLTLATGIATSFAPTPAAGPAQAQNAMLKMTGTLTGNAAFVCTRPGFYIVYNNCTVGSFVVTISNGSGSTIGLPPGALWHIFNDGTNYYHCNLPQVGELSHFCVATTPGWITASTLPPYLGCDGSTYNISAYPNLGASLGSTFGGNGVTTFGVPDLRGRVPLAIDYTGTRITAAGAGFNGQTLGTSGGLQSQTLSSSNIPLLTTGGQSAHHTHTYIPSPNIVAAAGPGSTAGQASAATNTSNESNDHTHTTGTATPAGVTTVQPSQVTGIWLVRAA